MTKEDIIIDMIKELKAQRIEDRKERIQDRKEQKEDKKEILERVSSFEATSNLHFSAINNNFLQINNTLDQVNNTLSHERTRIDSIYEERKNVGIKFSRKLVAANTFFAGIVAFCVSFFVK